ncbi:MAG: hypothetical protein AMXMBFR84_41170 [Candidatus Hydrogenedentota bacterium]
MAGSKRVIAEINITPLTDIFLVLLIIMMVVAPLLNYTGLPTMLESAEGTSESDAETKTLLVEVAQDGALVIDGERIESGAVVEKLRSEKTNFPDGILLSVHPDAPLDSLARVMDNSRTAGITSISISEAELDEK